MVEVLLDNAVQIGGGMAQSSDGKYIYVRFGFSCCELNGGHLQVACNYMSGLPKDQVSIS